MAACSGPVCVEPICVCLHAWPAGVRLQLERLVLVRFQVAAPDAAQPVLWPGGLTAGRGEYMNMTDVRVIVDSQELFNNYLEFFASQSTLFWTVSSRRLPGGRHAWSEEGVLGVGC